jgi:hypothetical protein
VKHLRWVPHSLADTHKSHRITLSNQRLLEIRLIKHQGWHFILNLDESWFYLSTDHEQIWLRPDQEPPERAKHTIQDTKIMVTIAWNVLRFHLVEALPKGRRFNAEYYRDTILTQLIRLRPQAGERNLVIHADNAKSKGDKMVRFHPQPNFCFSNMIYQLCINYSQYLSISFNQCRDSFLSLHSQFYIIKTTIHKASISIFNQQTGR